MGDGQRTASGFLVSTPVIYLPVGDGCFQRFERFGIGVLNLGESLMGDVLALVGESPGADRAHAFMGMPLS